MEEWDKLQHQQYLQKYPRKTHTTKINKVKLELITPQKIWHGFSQIPHVVLCIVGAGKSFYALLGERGSFVANHPTSLTW